MIAVLRVERRVTFQPSVAIRDDDFCVWVRWQRLYLVVNIAGETVDKFERRGEISEIRLH